MPSHPPRPSAPCPHPGWGPAPSTHPGDPHPALAGALGALMCLASPYLATSLPPPAPGVAPGWAPSHRSPWGLSGDTHGNVPKSPHPCTLLGEGRRQPAGWERGKEKAVCLMLLSISSCLHPLPAAGRRSGGAPGDPHEDAPGDGRLLLLRPDARGSVAVAGCRSWARTRRPVPRQLPSPGQPGRQARPAGWPGGALLSHGEQTRAGRRPRASGRAVVLGAPLPPLSNPPPRPEP